MLKFSKHASYRNILWWGWNPREITFQQYRENLAKAGVFRWVTNIHEHKRYYYTFDNSLLFTESIQNTTNLSAKSQRPVTIVAYGALAMQYVYALNPVCIVLIIPETLRREVPRQGCGHD